MSKRILFVSTMDGSPWGGSEELWFEAAQRLKGEGREVAAAVLKWPSPAAKLGVLRGQGIPVTEYGAPSAPRRLLNKVHPPLKHAWIRGINPQFVVLSQGGNWSIKTIEVAEALTGLGVPYVVISQCAYPWYWPSDQEAARMRDVFSKAKASYFVSKANLETSRLQVGDAIANGSVIRNPFAVEYVATLPWPDGQTMRLACVARVEPGIKGQDLLFEALSEKIWRERDITVALYGAGSNIGTTRALHQRYGLPRVEFGGFVKPAEIWRQNHALILTSRAEGLPVALVEAMLCGRPAILTDVGGNREAVEDGVSGFIASSVTASGVAEAMERAWQQRDGLQQMGKSAAARIRRLVSPDPAGDLARAILAMV